MMTMGQAAGVPKPSRSNFFLVLLYILMLGLCTMMVFWILIFPSSWLVGNLDSHDAYFQRHHKLYNDGISIVPPEIVTKYRGHRLVQMTHNLPAVFWSLGMPFQLHPYLRSRYRRAHQLVGYGMLMIGSIMMYGVCLIIWRKLTFEYDFPDLPPKPKNIGRILNSDPFLHDTDVAMIGIGVWFLYTLFMGVYHASVTRNIHLHRRFVVRHAGAGIWVALQRLLLGVVYAPLSPPTRTQQRQAFGDAGFIAVFITVSLAELAVWCMDSKRKETKKLN